MMNTKTQTDIRFEAYLTQRGLKFDYEPFSSPTNPDYLFYKNRKSILVECEEIEKIPFDDVRPGVGSLDMGKEIAILARKIYVASKFIPAPCLISIILL